MTYFLIFRHLAPQASARWCPRLFFLALAILGVPLLSATLPDLFILSAIGFDWDEPPDEWVRHKQVFYELSSLPPTICQPVSPIGIIEPMQGAPVDELAGTYQLTMIANPPTTIDTISVGYLWLDTADERHRQIREWPGSFPLYGASSVDLEGLGEVDFLYRITSSDPDLPGVQAHYDDSNGELVLWFGAATTKQGMPLHTGVLFTVQKVDSAGFAGSWTGAGLRAAAGGYYCARRFDPELPPNTQD